MSAALSCNKPNKPVSADTVSNGIKHVLSKCGILTLVSLVPIAPGLLPRLLRHHRYLWILLWGVLDGLIIILSRNSTTYLLSAKIPLEITFWDRSCYLRVVEQYKLLQFSFLNWLLFFFLCVAPGHTGFKVSRGFETTNDQWWSRIQESNFTFQLILIWLLNSSRQNRIKCCNLHSLI